MENMNYAVIATYKASKFEPEHKRTVAVFSWLIDAQDFIEKCIPEETRERFTLEHI